MKPLQPRLAYIRVLYPGRIGIFVEGEKPENAEKTPRSDENQQQTQPTYDTGLGFEPGPLRLRIPCSPTLK